MGDIFDLFNTYRVSAQHLTSVLLAAAIWRWGGGPERWLIGIFLATMVMPIYPVRWLGLTTWEVGPLASASFIIDCIAAVLFVGVALQANRNYPLWIAGFQVVALGGHLVRTVIEGISPLAIAVLAVGPSYCQLLLIIAGFVRHTRRERRFGQYREWRPRPAVAGAAGPGAGPGWLA